MELGKLAMEFFQPLPLLFHLARLPGARKVAGVGGQQIRQFYELEKILDVTFNDPF